VSLGGELQIRIGGRRSRIEKKYFEICKIEKKCFENWKEAKIFQIFQKKMIVSRVPAGGGQFANGRRSARLVEDGTT
jgi:hypothetical protein